MKTKYGWSFESVNPVISEESFDKEYSEIVSLRKSVEDFGKELDKKHEIFNIVSNIKTMESFGYKSTEAVMENIKEAGNKIIEGLKKFFDKMIEYLQRFGTWIKTTLIAFLNKITGADKEKQELANKLAEETAKYESQIANITKNSSITIEEMKKQIESLNVQLNVEKLNNATNEGVIEELKHQRNRLFEEANKFEHETKYYKDLEKNVYAPAFKEKRDEENQLFKLCSAEIAEFSHCDWKCRVFAVATNRIEFIFNLILCGDNDNLEKQLSVFNKMVAELNQLTYTRDNMSKFVKDYEENGVFRQNARSADENLIYSFTEILRNPEKYKEKSIYCIDEHEERLVRFNKNMKQFINGEVSSKAMDIWNRYGPTIRVISGSYSKVIADMSRLVLDLANKKSKMLNSRKEIEDELKDITNQHRNAS